MKVALINPGKTNSLFSAPLSLGYLASYARKYGKEKHDFIIIDETIGQKIEKKLSEFQPDVVGVSTLTTVSKRAYEIAEFAKKQFNAKTIIGGIHASVLREKILKDSLFDVVVVGEGEQTFLELLESKNMENIKGIIYRKDSKIIQTEKRELIKNIDMIPFPARDLMDIEFYLSRKDQIQSLNKRNINIITSRGCPYNCVFCSVNKVFGGVVRFHSPDYVKKEITELKKYNFEALFFTDDTFTINIPRLKEICGFIKKNNIPFFCLGRANLVNREILQMLKESGCAEIGFGFESMSPKILKYLKKNTVTVEQNRNAVRLCKEVGLNLQSYFMIGSPNETREDIQKTVDFIDEEKIIPTIFVTTPYPGTELWDWCEENDLIPSDINWSKALFDYRSQLHASNVLTKEEVTKIFLDLLGKYTKKRSALKTLRKIILRPEVSLETIKDYIKNKVNI
ncbi:MAG: radical SAM protein [Candidatus Aenigmatarchaeota archaeon]